MGLIVLFVAGIVAIVGVLSNAGAGHPPTENFRVRLSPHGVDRHVVPLRDRGRRGGAPETERALGRRTASRGPDARRAAPRFQREMAFINRDRDTRLEHQQRVDTATAATVNSDGGATPRRRRPLLVAYKTRTQQRHVKGETIRDQAEQNALQVRHQEALADESAVKAHAAQVEVDVKTARAWRV